MNLDIRSSFILFAILNAFSLLFFLGYKLWTQEKRAALNIYILANGILTFQWLFYAMRNIYPGNWSIIISNGLSFLGIIYALYAMYIADNSYRRRDFTACTIVAFLWTIVHAIFVNKPEYFRITSYSLLSALYLLIALLLFVRKVKQSRLYLISSLLVGTLSAAFIIRALVVLFGDHSITLMKNHWTNQLTFVIFYLLFYSEAIIILLIIKEQYHKKIEADNLELQKVNTTKNKLISVMAHDLRNHFNAILGFSNLLKDNEFDLSSKEGKQYINILNEQAENTNGLLESLLTWSRSQSNQLAYLPEQINLNELIAETLENSRNVASLKHIALNYSILGSNKIYADKNMLTTILRNLISNSIKFTPSMGKIDVTILERLDSFEFSIKDNGVGLKEGTINKLFDAGLNSSTPGTNNEKGTGLGLLLCKEFVEKHNGKIWANSKPGMGSEFIFTIPKEIKE